MEVLIEARNDPIASEAKSKAVARRHPSLAQFDAGTSRSAHRWATLVAAFPTPPRTTMIEGLSQGLKRVFRGRARSRFKHRKLGQHSAFSRTARLRRGRHGWTSVCKHTPWPPRTRPRTVRSSSSTTSHLSPTMRARSAGTVPSVSGGADAYVPGPPYCTYGLRVPASCVLWTLETWGSLPRGATHCTYTVHAPASGVPHVPRTVARQVSGCTCAAGCASRRKGSTAR